MSTIADPVPAAQLLPVADPYYYGFRDEPVLQPDGTSKTQRIALTLQDHLHPHEGDFFMEGPIHDLLRSYVRDVFRWRVRHDPTAWVLSNSGIVWDNPALGNHAPDVAVVFGVRLGRLPSLTFHVAEEGVRPSLILELVSPRYPDTDVVEKFREYHLAQVPLYVILDKQREDDPWAIRGYQRSSRRYVPLPLDERGRLWLQPVELWLAALGQQVLCFEDEAEEPLGDYLAIADHLERVQALAETEKARADAEKTRADVEKTRADAEKARADAAEARLREVEARQAKK